jgi:hypothetical protein
MQSDSSPSSTECSTEAQAQQFCHGSPSEGMMCLCTMEDITEETGNYGESSSSSSSMHSLNSVP